MTNTKPTTIRLPDEVLNELDRRARDQGETEDKVVAAYRAGRLSLSQAVSRLGTDAWSLFDILSRRAETLSVSLEDWMDSGSSRSA